MCLSEHSARDWQVLLIGGASGVGKTSVAEAVARRLGVSLSQADSYRLMLERTTTADAFPALHRRSAAGGRPRAPETQPAAEWAEVAREVSGALEVVVAFHAATRAAMILEGDTLLPALASARVLAGVPTLRRVRAVFLHEPSASRLRARLVARGRGYDMLSAAEQECQLRRTMEYGDWLAAEAVAHRCPVLVPSDGPNGVSDTAARLVALVTRRAEQEAPAP